MDAQRPLAVVTPTLDGDVLGILAVADAAFTTGQLHRTLSRFSEDGIRKALARLRDQGIVLSEPAGNAHLYRFNQDHLAAEPIRALATLRQKLLTRIEERLGSWKWAPVYAAVFGSMARATAGTGSDIDLLLVKDDDVPDEKWDAQVADLAHDISTWTGNDTRPITFTVSEVARRRTEPLFAKVVADGLIVFGKRSWLQRQIGGRDD